jgi:hypothetical protein
MTDKQPTEILTVSPEDVFRILIHSIQSVLASATQSEIHLFPHGADDQEDLPEARDRLLRPLQRRLHGLVAMNFSEDSAMEIYRNYMTHMGMPEEELGHELHLRRRGQ